MHYKRQKARLILVKDEIDSIFPVTTDEYMARDENEKLHNNECVRVQVEDNHVVHLREHAQAKGAN